MLLVLRLVVILLVSSHMSLSWGDQFLTPWVSTCVLKGRMQLRGPTRIECFEDMRIESGSVLITNGFELLILAARSLKVEAPPSPSQTTVVGKAAKSKAAPQVEAKRDLVGLSILSFDGPAPNRNAGMILIQASDATGYLQIHNFGLGPNDQSGAVIVEIYHLNLYDQDIFVAPGTRVSLMSEGYSQSPQGPTFKFPSLIRR